MPTLLASKVAKVIRHAPVAGFTDRDYRHLIHACEESPRRAIRVIKAGEAQAYVDTYRGADDEHPDDKLLRQLGVEPPAPQRSLLDLAAALDASRPGAISFVTVA